MKPETFLGRLRAQAWSSILIALSRQEIAWLLTPGDHLSLLDSRRAAMIISRVKLVAALFALLTPLWLVLDILAFPAEIWHGLMYCRIAATVAFAGLFLIPFQQYRLFDAYRALVLLLAIPTAFFIYSYLHMAQFKLQGLGEAFAVGYAYLPFVMLAGLSIFPLTLLESAIFATPMLLSQILAAYLNLQVLSWPTFAASFWLLLLITAVSTLAGISQLAFMIVLVREAARDRLTGCFSRGSGEELLQQQFAQAVRQGQALTAAFIDIDHFKQVNDVFGHEAGDRLLSGVGLALWQSLRHGDVLVRWGGEEFLLVMPDTDRHQAEIALHRAIATGLGLRPDGTPVTASIGIAERLADACRDDKTLVETADARMYAAKRAGRNRIVCTDEATT
ncbi:GGDEF domain-containing protein [Denitratisoma sp. agr-D3]